MAGKRRVSFIYFYQEKFFGDRSPLDPMRPTQLDKGLIIDFWSCILDRVLSFLVVFLISKFNSLEAKERKVQVGVLSVC